MPRPTLAESHIHPAVRDLVAGFHRTTVQEVIDAVAAHDVVVVGMRQNPNPRFARKTLDTLGQPYKYLEYGSYFSEWRRRLAIKMWSGWPTFPMVFVKGQLVGGASDLKALVDNGQWKALIAAPRA